MVMKLRRAFSYISYKRVNPAVEVYHSLNRFEYSRRAHGRTRLIPPAGSGGKETFGRTKALDTARGNMVSDNLPHRVIALALHGLVRPLAVQY